MSATAHAAPETAAERDRLKAINAELLEALKITTNDLAFEIESKWLNPSSDKRIILARAAIAKATGSAA